MPPRSRKGSGKLSDPIGELLGRKFRFRPSDMGERCLRHRDNEIWVDVYAGEGMISDDSTFTIVGGLAGIGISFQSENYPNRFIRHSGGECFLHEFEDSESFKDDASWIPFKGLSENISHGYSFQSVNRPGWYLRHADSRVRIDEEGATESYKKNATWTYEKLKDLRGEDREAPLYLGGNGILRQLVLAE